MKTFLNISTVLLFTVVSFVFGFYCSKYSVWLYPPQSEKLTILEVEEKYPIEILAPTIRELQEHANHYGAEIVVDNIYGSETARQTDRVRCNQMCIKIMEKMSYVKGE